MATVSKNYLTDDDQDAIDNTVSLTDNNTWTGVNTFTGSVSIGGAVPLTASSNIQDLNNVVISSPANDQVLTYNGANWVNSAAAAAGETNTASNVGTGEGVFAQKNGVDLEFKSIEAGDGINVTSTADEVTISRSPQVTEIFSGSFLMDGNNTLTLPGVDFSDYSQIMMLISSEPTFQGFGNAFDQGYLILPAAGFQGVNFHSNIDLTGSDDARAYISGTNTIQTNGNGNTYCLRIYAVY